MASNHVEVALGELSYAVRAATERQASMATEVRLLSERVTELHTLLAVERAQMVGDLERTTAQLAATRADLATATERLNATGTGALRAVDYLASWFSPSPVRRGGLIVAVAAALVVGGRLLFAVQDSTLDHGVAQVFDAVAKWAGKAPDDGGSAIASEDLGVSDAVHE
jgi:hypothetical protein